MRNALQTLHGLDVRLFQAAAGRPMPVLDRVLPPLTHSADHGGLWFGVAGLLAATKHRRAAVRGLASLGVASAVANGPLKYAVRRRRPELVPVPMARRLLKQPTTSSFPSGHSASAGAFALGVALEEPRLAAPVGLLAAGVAWGRVHTGVHYPGDVLAGLALGATCAYAVKRAWPAKPEEPATARRAVQAPALPDGAGLVLVVNEGGGSAPDDELEKALAEALPGAEVVRATDDLEQVLRDAARRATVLGAMGGDGTLSCAAGVALQEGVPLAVFPGGTLNHFAGELGLQSVEDAIEAVRSGTAVQVTVGSAAPEGSGMPFLNTFSLGVYPDLVRERERHEDRLGKWPAMALATARVMRRAQPVPVRVDGRERRVWTLFAGNGRYHPEGAAPTWRERLDQGELDLRVVGAERPLSRLRVSLALLTGLLDRTRVYEERVVERVELQPGDGACMARDGEVQDAPSRLVLTAASQPLVVYAPDEACGQRST